jgi:tryptophan-rich sensory protein
MSNTGKLASAAVEHVASAARSPTLKQRRRHTCQRSAARMCRWLQALLPLAAISLAGARWPMRGFGCAARWRPSPKTFGVVWTFLAVATGLVWAFGGPAGSTPAPLRNAAFALLVLLLASFAPLTSLRGASAAPAICTASLAAALTCALITEAPYSIGLAPLCGWLVLATQLAVDAAQCPSSPASVADRPG